MNASDFYDLVYNFCQNKGLLRLLDERLKSNHLDLVNIDSIEGKGLDVLDAVHCVVDKNRTIAFLEEIDLFVSPLSNVIEVGLGTGILAFYAAHKGAQVVGIEVNEATFALANELKVFLIEKQIIDGSKVELVNINVFNYSPSISFNVVICENIYTGLFREQQVKILNYVLSLINKDEKVIIPSRIDSYVALAEAEFPAPVYTGQEVVPSGDNQYLVSYSIVTDYALYDSLDFLSIDREGVNSVVDLVRRSNKGANCLSIYSDVHLPSGKILKHDQVTFMNNLILIAIDQSAIPDTKKLRLSIKYLYGSATESVVFSFLA